MAPRRPNGSTENSSMMTPIRIVGISGNVGRPSHTPALVQHVGIVVTTHLRLRSNPTIYSTSDPVLVRHLRAITSRRRPSSEQSKRPMP
jgi:hypothetical protein